MSLHPDMNEPTQEHPLPGAAATPALVEDEAPLARPPQPHWLARVAVTGGLLGAGGLVAALLIASTGEAEQGSPSVVKVPVEIMTLTEGSANALVGATGAVQAARTVTILPEVSGRITWVSEQLLPGGRLAAGAPLARIDDRNYRVAVAAETSKVRQAELELELEKGRGDVAQREWALLGADGQRAASPALALRHPNLAVAEQGLEAARISLEKARLDLGRTSLTAPFNAVVVAESVDLGQVIGQTTQVATLIDADRFWVQASLPVDRLAVIDVPGVPRPDGSLPELGSVAEVRQTLADGSAVIRQGTVISRGGQLDPQTRNATVIVAIDKPLDPPDGGLPLYPGAFVDVQIIGRPLNNSFRLPRQAVAGGDTVWVVAEGDVLERRTVKVAWSLAEDLIVSEGLAAGDRVVTSAMSAPLDGQPVLPRSSATEG